MTGIANPHWRPRIDALSIAVVSLCVALVACEEERAQRPEPSSAQSEEAPTPEAPAEPEPTLEVPEEMAAALEALGYVESAPTTNPDQRGVTTSDSAGTDRSLNLYSSRRQASAILTDMAGEVVHRWEVKDGQGSQTSWMHVEPLPTGELLVISKDDSVAKHGWDSSLLWRTRLRAHHDLAVHEDGRIFVIERDRSRFSFGGSELLVLTDAIVILSTDGRIERRVQLLPLFHESVSARRISRLRARVGDMSASRLTRPGAVGDVLHTNSIEFLKKEIPGVAPAGSLLLSFRAMSRVAIVDADISRVLWLSNEGETDGQHDATQLSNGNILLFDNGLFRNRDSRVLEVNPRTNAIEWTFDRDLFSRLRSGAQELPNGHILITESDTGHALEITRAGEKVWEFWNPDIRGEGANAERGVIYRLNRFPESYFAPLRDR